MAGVVKLANFIQKYADKEDVREYLESFREQWALFVSGELKSSNDTNNRSLGGQQPRHSMDDDEDGN